MKTMLVLDDMPKACADCPLHTREFGKVLCFDRDLNCKYYNRPAGCHLKPLPAYHGIQGGSAPDVEKNEAYWAGWNACLDTIVGGEE